MGARRLAAACLVLVCVAGCANAADVAKTDRTAKSQPRDGTKTTTPDETGGPDTSSTPSHTPSQTPSQTPSPTKSPSSKPPRGRQLPNVIGPVAVFLTPSRNIGCMITQEAARCDILERNYRDPERPGDCSGDFGRSLEVVKNDVASFVCATDTVFDRRAPVLAYSTSTVVGDFGCTSRQDGVRCYHLRSKHGFLLSGSVRLFSEPG